METLDTNPPEALTAADIPTHRERHTALSDAQTALIAAQRALTEAERRHSAQEAAWQAWALHLARAYRLTPGDQVHEDGAITRAAALILGR